MSLKKGFKKNKILKSLKLQQEQEAISEKKEKKGIPFFLFSSHKKITFS